MNDPIQHLIDDHINLAIVHRQLRDQMEIFQTGMTAENLSVLLDIIDYLKNYPECQHHAMEDKIYGIMRTRIQNRALMHLLDNIELQHGHLRVLSTRFQNGLLAIANDQVVNKEIIVADYNNYLSLYEEHIHCENNDLLPIIETYLSPEELYEIGNEMLNNQDPLFSGVKTQAYRNLFKHITEMQLPA